MRRSGPGAPRPWTTAGAGVVAAVYAWWATGLAPFTGRAYIAVALPSVALAVAYGTAGGWGGEGSYAAEYYRQRSGTASLTGALPWLVIAVAGVTVETVGLLLGGRSSMFPTLSTAVDHLLDTHGGRFVLFVLWLWVGFSPARRLLTHGQTGGD